MTFEMEMPEDFSGGNFLQAPGTYHLCVSQVLENQGPKGGMIDGFTVGFDVLSGTVPGQDGKTINVTFFNGKLTDKDQGKFRRVIQSCFMLAANLTDPSKRGQKISVDLQKAVGQQVIAKFIETRPDEDGKTYLQLDGASIWHIDDPRCAAIPKKTEAINLISKHLRHDAAWFEQFKSQAKQQQKQPAMAGAGSSAGRTNFDDL